MKLRNLLPAFGLALAAFFFPSRAADTSPPADEQGRQYYELRVYATQSEKQQTLVNDYWQSAAIPAYNRAGIQSVGVFTETQDTPTNKIYVLIPFDSLRAFEALPARLADDATYQTAAASFMNRSRNDAPHGRIDTSLLRAMTGMPKLALPPSTAEKNPWLFELRTYFSPTETKGANKIDMFNAGEIQIMKEIGLNPVFFAGTLIGPQTPNLIYMTSGPDMDQYKQTWRSFGPHPLWKKLSADSQYKDNMSGIQSVFLKRTGASQI
jgi:hypothetical protein